ncbi:MAG: glycosyltransferase, partial [Candidatus Eremiobacterota bacterium]
MKGDNRYYSSLFTLHSSRITILLSIITVTYNSKDVITECLSSLEKKLQHISSEIIVIDNHSTDNTIEIIKEQFPSVHVIENVINKGFAAACNQGIKHSSGDFLLFLNPDIIAGEKFSFSPLFEYMNNRKKAGLLGCKLINKDGTIQTSCRRFPDIITVIFKRIKIFQIF